MITAAQEITLSYIYDYEGPGHLSWTTRDIQGSPAQFNPMSFVSLCELGYIELGNGNDVLGQIDVLNALRDNSAPIVSIRGLFEVGSSQRFRLSEAGRRAAEKKLEAEKNEQHTHAPISRALVEGILYRLAHMLANTEEQFARGDHVEALASSEEVQWYSDLEDEIIADLASRRVTSIEDGTLIGLDRLLKSALRNIEQAREIITDATPIASNPETSLRWQVIQELKGEIAKLRAEAYQREADEGRTFHHP